MTLAYPGALPCASRVEGHAVTHYTGVVRTAMEAGNCRQRRAQRQVPQQITLAFVIDQALYAGWVAWVNAHAFTEFVLMPLPGVAAARAGTATTPTPVRFVSIVQAELLPIHRRWMWRVQVEAEWQPGA